MSASSRVVPPHSPAPSNSNSTSSDSHYPQPQQMGSSPNPPPSSASSKTPTPTPTAQKRPVLHALNTTTTTTTTTWRARQNRPAPTTPKTRYQSKPAKSNKSSEHPPPSPLTPPLTPAYTLNATTRRREDSDEMVNRVDDTDIILHTGALVPITGVDDDTVPVASRFVLVEGIPRDANWDALQSAFSNCPPQTQGSSSSGSRSSEIKGIFNGLLVERGLVRTSFSLLVSFGMALTSYSDFSLLLQVVLIFFDPRTAQSALDYLSSSSAESERNHRPAPWALFPGRDNSSISARLISKNEVGEVRFTFFPLIWRLKRSF